MVATRLTPYGLPVVGDGVWPIWSASSGVGRWPRSRRAHFSSSSSDRSVASRSCACVERSATSGVPLIAAVNDRFDTRRSLARHCCAAFGVTPNCLAIVPSWPPLTSRSTRESVWEPDWCLRISCRFRIAARDAGRFAGLHVKSRRGCLDVTGNFFPRTGIRPRSFGSAAWSLLGSCPRDLGTRSVSRWAL